MALQPTNLSTVRTQTQQEAPANITNTVTNSVAFTNNNETIAQLINLIQALITQLAGGGAQPQGQAPNPPIIQDGLPPNPPIADGVPPNPPIIQDGLPPNPPIADGWIVEPPVIMDGLPPEPPVIMDGVRPEPPVIMDGVRPEPPVIMDGVRPEPPVIMDGVRPEPPVIMDGVRPEPPVIMDGLPPEPPIADGWIVDPPIIQDGLPPEPPVIQDGLPTTGDQDPHTVSYGKDIMTLSNSDNVVAFRFDELPALFTEFEQSDAYPDMQTMDLHTTPWGYSGSSSALNAFHNYLLDNYDVNS